MNQATNIPDIIRTAKRRFILERHGLHGIAHWSRVRENGQRIAENTGADKLIVDLFAYLHDCCREDEGSDLGHGQRAAEFARTLRGTLIHIPDDDFEILYEAIRDHELGYTQSNMSVMTCWDADRLDLGRVGIRPLAKYLCTDFAREKATIEWAFKRSTSD